jgi:uncharacterized protein
MLTRKCNLKCAFCYIQEKAPVEVKDEVARNINTCNWIVKQFRAEPSQNNKLQINLYGGEPTCAWDSVQALVGWAKEIKDIAIKFCIVTNMVLMDETKIDYCISNNISISPSIDGCKEVEDMFRITAEGKTVSDQVFKHAKILTSKLKGRSCRSTISPQTAPYMFESIKYITKELGFSTVNQILAGGVKWADKDIEVVREQTEKITDWWLDEMRTGNHYSIYYLRNMFNGIWNPVRRRGLCSSGMSHGAIDTNGNIYPCHRFCNESTPEEYKMGNINESGFTNTKLYDILRSFDLAKHHKDRCNRCPAVNSCMALCLHEMMLNGSMFEPLEHYCKVWPIYYSEAMRAHAILDAEKNQLYYRTYKPRPPIVRK